MSVFTKIHDWTIASPHPHTVFP